MTGVAGRAELVGQFVLIGLVLSAAIPMLAGTAQIVLASLHGYRNHYAGCAPYCPRTAVLVPAWNEGPVLAAAIDALLSLDYPADRLRVYIVDDASTDNTGDVLRDAVARHGDAVVPVRRQQGGQGKAHTLNEGLRLVLADDWAQAVLITDADVIHQPDSLRRMTRHLADPAVGAVTAYIMEGTRPGTYLNRFIGYEYVTAQAAARRGQNVLGALACLAGGAQLHSRASLERIGGQIDTHSLAEDTVTTIAVQLAGRRVVFEPTAVVWAEEPSTIAGLWKQRLRWARGNIQVTLRFRHIWFRRRPRHRLGGFWFGLVWFSLLLQPLFLVLASISLVTLYVTSTALASHVFSALWITNAVTYVFITGMALLLDPVTARRTWVQAIAFPGLVSLSIMAYQVYPPLFTVDARAALAERGIEVTSTGQHLLVLGTYVWVAGCMGLAWLAKRVERSRVGRWLTPAMLYVVGYGPLLCAMTLSAYAKELRRSDLRWEKTEKVGRVGA